MNPWPESLLAYTPMWSRLAEQAHLVAIDLPGFGHSERRAELFSLPAMGEFVVRVADEVGLENPHVIGPDVGTPAALFAAANHPGRFRSLVVGAGAIAVPLQTALNELLPQIETPVQIISGERDEFVPRANSEFLHARLPNSKLDVLDAGHYPWEDAADAYAELVTAWLQGSYANIGK